MRTVKNSKKLKQEIAKERINRLFYLADFYSKTNSLYSKKYCLMIDKIRKTVNLRLSKQQKIKFCKKCHTFWIPGNTVKIIQNHSNKRIIYRCLNCGSERKFGYLNKK
ncbi:hypothetical protein KO465_03815 [Candidatus Micrarchaeota archaeon]|nr:hypothetical protein [Candidatus Micrarchaeota archaeon]